MRRLHLLIALGVLLLDRFTKRLVARDISLHDSITVIKRVFYITHVENRGAASVSSMIHLRNGKSRCW